QRKEPLTLGDDAAAVALRTDHRRRSRLRTRAATLTAGGRYLDRNLRLEPAQRVLERHVDGDLDVGTTLRLSALRARAAAVEQAAEEVPEIAEVGERVVATSAEVEVTRVESRTPVRGAERVVLLPLLRVGQDVVGV